MRLLLSTLALITVGAGPAASQDAPSCATLLTADEIRSTCGVAEATVEVSTTGDDRCRISAQRPGAVSAFVLDVYAERDAQMAAATVEIARALGRSSSGSAAPGDADRALGQVFEVLGVQDAGAEAADGVSAEDAALRELPDLGDGGVRYVSDAAGGIGLVTHAVVFSDGATVVKLESGIVAGRAGVCTVDGLEALARRVAGRL